ncbi:MAG: FxsA family protein [Deltaproteobacteria bacterium]|nr:FxsA family protein [Deltaproteobacteria bacterium]
MLLKLFLAFTIIPVVEIYLLIQIGSAFGVFTSIALVVFTGFLGAYLARIQGLQTLFRIQESLKEGHMPSGELLDALLIGVAGLVLLTPGFLTDTVGFVLLIPSTRNAIKAWLQSKIKTQYMSERPEDTIIEQ